MRLKKRVISRRPRRGDIVYWCLDKGNGHYDVAWGMVDEVFHDAVVVDHLEPMERRLIKPRWDTKYYPLDKFEDTRYHKLPKGWTYELEMYDIIYEVPPEEMQRGANVLNLNDVGRIKELYAKGILVKSSKKFHGDIEAEITKEGYRIVKKYPMWSHHIDHRWVRPDLIRFSYDEAKKDVENERAEFIRISELSDYEWSMENIEKTTKLFRVANGLDDRSHEVKEIRDFFSKMEPRDVERVESRVSLGRFQWKFENQKRWATLI